MATHFLLVGAGHAHLTILKNLRTFLLQGRRISVINAKPHHYYSGMGPGMLSEIYSPRQIRFHVEKMVRDQGGHFIGDQVVSIDPENQAVKTAGGRKISYDIVSFNIGSHVPFPETGKSVNAERFFFPVKPIQNLFQAKNQIIFLMSQKRPKIMVAGGGAAGVEIAVNIRALGDKKGKNPDITLLAGGTLLSRFNERFRATAKTILRRRRIHLIEHSSAGAISNHCIRLSTGVSLPCDLVLWAVGTRPSALFKDSGLPTGADGGLMVNEYLQSTLFPNIFGGGDCIFFKKRPLEKVGVYAVRQNSILLKNLINFSTEKQLIPFIPQKDFLTILNMGNGKGLLQWKNLVHNGMTPFLLKDFIDRRFMKKFRISDESDQ